MLKKIFVILTILIATLSITAITLPQNSFAADTNTRYGSGEACPDFLGLISWDCNVPKIENETVLRTGIWQIAANIATDITIIAAYLVLGYVIYGGYLYTFSYGDPGKVAAGKKTLSQAFIGLAITMLANVIMGGFRIALVGSSGNIGACATGNCVGPSDLVANLITWFTSIAGVVSAIFLVYGGILYTTSAGDPNKVQKAKSMITYSLIGLAIVALATTITAFVSNAIREANNKNAYSNNIIISKEVYENKIN